MKLKKNVKTILIILLVISSIIIFKLMLDDYKERITKYYNECDAYYGYEASYYQCRLYYTPEE